MVSIHQVQAANRRERQDFIDLPFRLYKDHPLWVPELKRSTRAYFDKQRHPFYQHSDADFFIAKRGDVVVGRIVAIENRRFNGHKGIKSAFFGLFDAENDQNTATALFDAAIHWAKKRQLDQIIGPRGFLGLDGKVLVKGFEHLPTLGEPYNFPYYEDLILRYGFQVDSDYLTGYFPSNTRPTARYQRVINRLMQRNQFKIKRFKTRSETIQWLPKLLELQKKSFAETRTYYPISAAEAENMLSSLKLVADHRLIKLLMRHDEPVGLIIALPDISKGLQRANGKLFPLGWWHVLRSKTKTDQALILAIGILPEYQGLGGNALLHAEIISTFNQSKFAHVEVGPIDSENVDSINDMEKEGVTWIKTHRLYRLKLS